MFGFTPTVTVAGVVVLVVLAVSQFKPVVVVVEIEKFNAVDVVPIEIRCAAGIAPPIWKLNGAGPELVVSITVGPTSTVIGIVCVGLLAPVAEICRLPVYVPAAYPDMFTATVMLCGLYPEVGAVEIQGCEAVTVKAVDAPLLDVNVNNCPSG